MCVIDALFKKDILVAILTKTKSTSTNTCFDNVSVSITAKQNNKELD